MTDIAALENILRCPKCSASLDRSGDSFACTNQACIYSAEQESFPAVAGQPVLIDFEQSLFDRTSFAESLDPARPGGAAPGSKLRQRGKKIRRRILRGDNSTARKMAKLFLEHVKKISTPSQQPPRILVIGGGTEGSGTEPLYADKTVELIGTDVFASPLTMIVSDGHQLPFVDESFDGVWVQAVLEHVLEPTRVVAEIHRVLRPRGLIYADTPFMQQVHMDAYDFTRFTLSGHRYLFRNFELIEAGMSGGPGIATIWSIRYLARSLGAPPWLASAIAALFFWLRFLDRFSQSRAGTDAASGVYFLGRKSDTELTGVEVIAFYEGFVAKQSARP